MNLPDFLTEDSRGYIHFTDHRIGLEDVVWFYRQGDSAEMLQARFPTLALAMCHKAIAFYLENQQEVDLYCLQNAQELARLRAAAPSGPDIEELRRRREKQRLAQGA